MTQDDLKRYTVVVGDGSGCFFQPMTEHYTYIITAKHLFFDEIELPSGQKTYVPKFDGTAIEIYKHVTDGNTWNLEIIPFVLHYGENYFPHEMADVAILKISPQDDLNMINIDEDEHLKSNVFLCGFPSTARGNATGERYQTKDVYRLGASGNFSRSAQLVGNLNQHDIEGMSGGALLELNTEGISYIGTQSKMASSLYPAGGIGYVQSRYVREIIDYVGNVGKLEKLFPNILSNFSFLRDKAFIFDVNELDAGHAERARKTLLNKAQHIIDSELTPFGIKELFRDRLLVNEKEITCLGFNAVWIAWLEFLTIMNISKYENIDNGNLTDIFNLYRLKYVNTEDWTANPQETYLKSNYLGMQPNSTVIVSSRNPAKTKFKIPKGTLIDIRMPYDKSGFRTDKGIHPFTSFDFVHIDYFKIKCIAYKIEDYHNLITEEEIIEKLKAEYHELFS